MTMSNTKIKQFFICVEGIDKSNKSLLCSYVWYLSKYKNVQMYDRGMISVLAYADLYNRNVEVDFESEKQFKFVYLTVDKKDWEIKCKLSNEPEIDYEKNLAAFEKAKNIVKQNGYDVREYNVSVDGSMYQIAKKVIEDFHIDEDFGD